MSIKFSQLITGNTDARHEVKLNDPVSVKDFKSIFIKPDGFNVNEFITGEKFIINGLKGTGKSALLYYIALELPNETSSDFVYFKSDLKEDDRDEIEKLSTFVVKSNLGFTRNDYEKAWLWFFLKRITEINETMHFIIEDDNYQKAKSLLFSVNCEKRKTGLSYLFPEVIDGKVEINIAEIAKLGIDVTFKERKNNSVKFSEVVDKAYDLFLDLRTKGKFVLFVDELELSYLNDTTYKRDSELIRDLIITVKELNILFKENNMDLSLITAVRSEVLNAISTIGKEIQKITEDFGFPVTWYRYENRNINHPLMKVFINRLRLSEIKACGECKVSDTKLYKTYVQENMFGRETAKIFLNSTWYRPRDIVRWFKILKIVRSNDSHINQSAYETVRRDYSNKSLNEIYEELNTVYDQDSLEGIQTIFTGFKKSFSKEEFITRVKEKSSENKSLETLIEERNELILLEHLFTCGFIGNYYKTVIEMQDKEISRWIYRGDRKLLVDKNMIIHPSLRPALSIRDYK